MGRRVRRKVSGAVVGALFAPTLAGASAPEIVMRLAPACSSSTVTWKFAAAAGAPDGFPNASVQATVINGFNKWLGTGMKKGDGSNLFTITQNNAATFKVYYRELDAVPGFGPSILGAYSCGWNSYFGDIPAGPHIVMDPSALGYGTTIFTHEMGHAVGLNHSGRHDSLGSGTSGSSQVMNTCISFPFNQALGRDDYAQSQWRVNSSIHTSNPSFETTTVGWDTSSTLLEPNAEAGAGVNSLRLHAPNGQVSTATRIVPKKDRILVSARFKGSVAAAGGGRFKAYYRHTFAPSGPVCGGNEFGVGLDLNAIPSGLPAFQILHSTDFNLTTSWTSIPAFTGAGAFMPPTDPPPGPGQWVTDMKIEAQNNTTGTIMWVDNFIGAAI